MSLRQTLKSAFYQVQRRWGRWRASHNPARAETAIVVFALHTIAPARSDMAISVARFREQMQALLEAGYRALTMDQLLSILSNRTPLPGRAFTVTFDDGYQSVLTDALPLLEELQIPATAFLATGFLDGRVSPPWGSTD